MTMTSMTTTTKNKLWRKGPDFRSFSLLYANGEDVYTWRIEEVELESPAVTL